MAPVTHDTVLSRIRNRYVHEDDLSQRLRTETAGIPHSNMLLDPEAGALLATLVRAIRPSRTLDIGVFTGYSSLTVARNAPDASIIALDIDDDITRIARRYWQEAGVADRIELHIGNALDALDALIDDGQAGAFDFAFIDADKPAYPDYYERVLTLLRPGGMIALDNTLYAVLTDSDAAITERARFMDAFTERMSRDDRVTTAVLPISSGMTIATRNG